GGNGRGRLPGGAARPLRTAALPARGAADRDLGPPLPGGTAGGPRRPVLTARTPRMADPGPSASAHVRGAVLFRPWSPSPDARIPAGGRAAGSDSVAVTGGERSGGGIVGAGTAERAHRPRRGELVDATGLPARPGRGAHGHGDDAVDGHPPGIRSEERRVGKECRYLWPEDDLT